MIYTSRYFNPELIHNSDKYSVVRISIGFPRFLPYNLTGTVKDLAPKGLLGIEDQHVFRQRYIEKLEYLGVERIGYLLQYFEQQGKPVVLCCYEDIRKGGDNWCHRTMFADWWYRQTGVFIDELADPSTYELELSDTPFADIMKETFGRDYCRAV